MRQFYFLITLTLITTPSAADSPRYRGDSEVTGTIWQTPPMPSVTPTPNVADNPKWQTSNVTTYPEQGSHTYDASRYRPLTTPQTVTLPELPRPVTSSIDNHPNYPNVANYPYYGAPNSNNYPNMQGYSENMPAPAKLPNQP